MKNVLYFSLLTLAFIAFNTPTQAQEHSEKQENRIIEPIPYGHFDKWMVHEVKESFIIGGDTKYTYEIIGVAQDTETDQPMMVYRARYGNGQLYVSPLEMFLSETDRSKYPDAVQTYRFEPMRNDGRK